MMRDRALFFLFLVTTAIAACSSDNGKAGPSVPEAGTPGDAAAKDPATATAVPIDRFSDAAAHLFMRSANAALPAANAAINFDTGPFITHGLGPLGEHVAYYNFDVQPTAPAPIYVFFAAGASTEFPGQLHVVDVIPGDPGYNDFWQVVKVTVPANYVANSLASAAEITASGYALTPMPVLVNCPIVPHGSTAALRYDPTASKATIKGWYKDKIVEYFSFETSLSPASSAVPVQPIYVTFNTNPADPGGGPPSGFKTETGSMQTHNVVQTLPADPTYSPLWQVVVYDNAKFASVADLATAVAATTPAPLVANAGDVNCPVVTVASGADAGADAQSDTSTDAPAD